MICEVYQYYIYMYKIYVRLHNAQYALENPASRLSAMTYYHQRQGGGWNSGTWVR